jgi:hypothetical protein
MARLKSNWKVTFDPGGTNQVVLVDYDDYLVEAFKAPWSNKVETSEPLEGESVIAFPQGQVRRDISLSVFKDHASFHACQDHCLIFDAELPLDVTSILKVEVSGGTGVSFANAAFVSGESVPVKGTGFQSLTTVKLIAGKATSL